MGGLFKLTKQCCLQRTKNIHPLVMVLDGTVFDEGKHGDLEISMEIYLILLQIVLNLDQRVKHLLINNVNRYSLRTLSCETNGGRKPGRGVGLKISFIAGGRGGGGVSVGRMLIKEDLCTILFFLYS